MPTTKKYSGKRFVAYKRTDRSLWSIYDKRDECYLGRTFYERASAQEAATALNIYHAEER